MIEVKYIKPNTVIIIKEKEEHYNRVNEGQVAFSDKYIKKLRDGLKNISRDHHFISLGDDYRAGWLKWTHRSSLGFGKWVIEIYDGNHYVEDLRGGGKNDGLIDVTPAEAQEVIRHLDQIALRALKSARIEEGYKELGKKDNR